MREDSLGTTDNFGHLTALPAHGMLFKKTMFCKTAINKQCI